MNTLNTEQFFIKTFFPCWFLILYHLFVSLLGCLVILHRTHNNKSCSIFSGWKRFVLSQRIYRVKQFCSWFSKCLKYFNCQVIYVFTKWYSICYRFPRLGQWTTVAGLMFITRWKERYGSLWKSRFKWWNLKRNLRNAK